MAHAYFSVGPLRKRVAHTRLLRRAGSSRTLWRIPFDEEDSASSPRLFLTAARIVVHEVGESPQILGEAARA